SAFLAALLDWHITGYFRVLERLEEDIDRLDDRAIHPREEHDFLAQLNMLRKRVALIRKVLTPHREIYAALVRPDLT
ncbi:CorA family divalent cation transporter, partial [Vibrio parahaemolyticus]